MKLSLKTDTTADALIMKGWPDMLSLGKRYVEEGFSFIWNSGERPVLTSPDGQGFDLDIEHYARCSTPQRLHLRQMAHPLCESGGEWGLRSSGGRSPPPSGERSPQGDSCGENSSSSDEEVNIPPDLNLTRFPKIPACPVCQRAKAQHTPHRRKSMVDNGSN